MDTMQPLGPLSTVDPIREIDGALETLLAGLSAEDWQRPAVKEWRVRDEEKLAAPFFDAVAVMA